MKKHHFLLVFLLSAALLLTGCAEDPRKQAEADAIRQQANTEADNAAQKREFAREDQDWENENRQRRAEFWNDVLPVLKLSGKIVAVALGVGGFVWALMTGISLGLGAYYTAQAYQTYVTIRARLIYPNDMGIRPQLLWTNAEKKGWFRHVHGSRWFLTDPVSGACTMLDVEKEPNAKQLEILRQVLLTAQVASAQTQSGKQSPHGEIAEAIGQSSFTLPDAGITFLKRLSDGHEQE